MLLLPSAVGLEITATDWARPRPAAADRVSWKFPVEKPRK